MYNHISGKDPSYRDQMVDALPTLKDRLKRSDANVLFSVVNDLAKVSPIMVLLNGALFYLLNGAVLD